jgi:hypothetical protein
VSQHRFRVRVHVHVHLVNSAIRFLAGSPHLLAVIVSTVTKCAAAPRGGTGKKGPVGSKPTAASTRSTCTCTRSPRSMLTRFVKHGRVHNKRKLLGAAPTTGLHLACLQEQKWRRQQQLDGLPSWSLRDEERLMQAINAACRAMLFCMVKS